MSKIKPGLILFIIAVGFMLLFYNRVLSIVKHKWNNPFKENNAINSSDIEEGKVLLGEHDFAQTLYYFKGHGSKFMLAYPEPFELNELIDLATPSASTGSSAETGSDEYHVAVF